MPSNHYTISYLLVHGWGYDATFWSNLVPLLHTDCTPCAVWERGYFGAFPSTQTYNSTLRIAITHSLGYIHLLHSNQPFTHCIVLQGFHTFLGDITSPHYKTRYNTLKKLHRILLKNSVLGLYTFYNSTELFIERNTISTERLIRDYSLLYGSAQEYFLRHRHIPHCICYSDNDRITPYTLIEENFRDHMLFCIPQSAHGLGFFNAYNVYLLIRTFLQKYDVHVE